ncbi:MAG: YdcF family protein, partial [Verrucomicrobiota bacterium]
MRKARTSGEQASVWRLKNLWPLGLPFALVLFLIAASPSLLYAQKILTDLALPLGMTWFGLLLATCWPGHSRRFRLFLGCVWGLLTLAGNEWAGKQLMRQLEQPYMNLAPIEEPLDVIFVHGGGIRLKPDGTAGLNDAAERLIGPARLYKEGKTRLLATGGQGLAPSGKVIDLCDPTAEIWAGLGIPEEAIVKVREGMNTKQEVAALAELKDRRGWTRVGQCTSAWHLQRATRLADNQGLRTIPVPGDFISGPMAFTTRHVIPQPDGIDMVTRAGKEFLAR